MGEHYLLGEEIGKGAYGQVRRPTPQPSHPHGYLPSSSTMRALEHCAPFHQNSVEMETVRSYNSQQVYYSRTFQYTPHTAAWRRYISLLNPPTRSHRSTPHAAQLPPPSD